VKSVDEHLADVLDGVGPLAPLDLGVLEAQGCALAEDVATDLDLPAFDNSSMDGYAVRVADVAGASAAAPVRLPVVGDIAAGSAGPYRVQPGFSVRIMTGAPVPPGAEAVVPQEWTDQGTTAVAVSRPATDGLNIRRRGEDVRRGQVVLPTGTRLGPPQLGLLAAVGRDRVRVRPRPRVVVLSTGSELVEPGRVAGPGQIHDANSVLLTAAARDAGAQAYRVGIVPDDPRRLLDTIEDQLIRADLVVTSGGVSVGAYDVVKDVLSRLGTVHFDTVAMQPGKPQGYGTVGADRTPIFTLPGNPVSSYVSFEVFVRPVIRTMLGYPPVHRPLVHALCQQAMRSAPGRRQFTRAKLGVEEGRYVVRPVGGPGSHLLAALAQADSLLIVPEDVTEVAAGSTVTVMPLDRELG
jgi:molybdopterin molybdotransferase